jgi:hypothetical protein
MFTRGASRQASYPPNFGFAVCFEAIFSLLARDMRVRLRWGGMSVPSSGKELAMVKIELYNDDSDCEPPVTFASDAEIEIADKLRRQLEERYLAPSAQSSQLQGRPSKNR